MKIQGWMRKEERPCIVFLERSSERKEMKRNSEAVPVDTYYGLLLMEQDNSILMPYAKN